MDLILTKSLILKGIQCNQSLWLDIKHSEIQESLQKNSNYYANHNFEVKKIAQCLFPGGISISEKDMQNNLHKTEELMSQGAYTLFKPGFLYDGMFIQPDIFKYDGESYEIYEVKTATSIKAYYLDDLALQYYIISRLGFKNLKASIIYINNKYIRKEELALEELFIIKNLTYEVIFRLNYIENGILQLKKALQQNDFIMNIGEQCHFPQPCSYIPYCWKKIPEYSIFNLTRMDKKQKFSLYAQGILAMDDIPDEVYSVLTERQQIQVESSIHNKHYMNTAKINEFLNCLYYPLYFIDFETFQLPVPIFPDTKPFEQIPFQFSLHVYEKPNSPLKHYEYLAEPLKDGRREIAEAIVKYIPRDSCILAYNSGFEKGIIKKLALFCEEYKDRLTIIQNNIKDLMIPFKNYDFYSNNMKGSYSIKSVLPALVPELTYKTMAIKNGLEASSLYKDLFYSHDAELLKKTKQDLLEYCKLDTYAMVKILEKLVAFSHSSEFEMTLF